MYKVALFGYSLSGKTFLFRLFTGKTGDLYDPLKPNIAGGFFKDEKLDSIALVAGIKKKVYPEFEFYDFKGMPENTGFTADYLRSLNKTDMIVCVVDNFSGEACPEKQSGSLLMELILHDAEIAEKLLNRKEFEKQGLSDSQVRALESGNKLLAEERCLSLLGESEKQLLSGIGFLTFKPLIFFVNGVRNDYNPGFPSVIMDKAENFSPADFYSGLFEALSLKTFYTIKGGIAQAWVVHKKLNAKESAGRVHKDIEKGFIKAASLHLKDFLEIGDWQKAKNMGVIKFLGPNSMIEDKDIVEFYFR